MGITSGSSVVVFFTINILLYYRDKYCIVISIVS